MNKNFLADVAKVASGNAVGKILALLLTPILTRLYGPLRYGEYSVFLSVTLILAAFAGLRYSYAIPLPRSDRIGARLVMISIKITAIQVVFIAIVIGLASNYIFPKLGAPELSKYWPLLIISFASVALFDIFSMWATRKKNYKGLALSGLYQNMVGGGVKVALGLLHFIGSGLLIGQIVNQIVGIRRLSVGFKHTVKFTNPRNDGFILRRFRDFPCYRMPSQLLLICAMQGPILLTSAFYGSYNAGQLSLAITVLAVPVMLVGQSLGQVYYAEVAALGKNRAKDIYNLSRSLINKLLLVSLIPIIFLITLGDFSFSFIFGPKWKFAGDIAEILALTLLGQFIANPISNVLSVFERQRWFLTINAVRAIGVFVIFAMGPLLGATFIEVLSGYAAYLSIHYLSSTVVIMRFLKNKANR